MSLDARVYCDCIEKGRLKTPYPYPALLRIELEGGPVIDSEDIDRQIEHDRWVYSAACEHPQCSLLDHFIGNIWLVGQLRTVVSELCDDPEREYPILHTKFIYNGVHSGDYLTTDQVMELEVEIARLRELDISHVASDKLRLWRNFLVQVDELIVAALLVNKPIVF